MEVIAERLEITPVKPPITGVIVKLTWQEADFIIRYHEDESSTVRDLAKELKRVLEDN